MVNKNGETIIAVTAVFLAISFVAVCLRCFVRLRIVKAFGWDDGAMLLAMVGTINYQHYGLKSVPGPEANRQT